MKTRIVPSSQPLITFPTPISVSNGDPLHGDSKDKIESRCRDVHVPVSTRIELFAIEKGPNIVYDDRVWTVQRETASLCTYAVGWIHAPPFLGNVTPSPGVILSMLTPCKSA